MRVFMPELCKAASGTESLYRYLPHYTMNLNTQDKNR